MAATAGTRWGARRLVRSCERAVWKPWRKSRHRPCYPQRRGVPSVDRGIEARARARGPAAPGLHDSEIVVDQVNGVSAVRKAHLSELHKQAKGLVAQFKSFRISWVPRELNAEADRLVNDALGALELRP